MKETKDGDEPTDYRESQSFKQNYAGTFMAKSENAKQNTISQTDKADQSKREILPMELKATLEWLRDSRNHQPIIAVCAIGAVILTAIYAVFAGLQWCTMRNQLAEMQKTNEITRQQMVGTQAAILQFNISEGGEFTLGVVGTIHNAGIMSATKIHLRVQIARQRFVNGIISQVGQPMVSDDSAEVIKGGAIWPEGAFPRTWNVPWVHHAEASDIKDSWPVSWPGNDLTEIKYHLVYENGFGEQRTFEDCRELLPRFIIRLENNTTTTMGGMYPCKNVEAVIPDLHSQWQKHKQR